MEVETRLQISDEATLHQFQRSLEKARQIGRFSIKADSQVTIADLYLDTSKRHFGHEGKALRIRTINGDARVCFKWDKKKNGSVSVREDDEVPPGPAARTRIETWLKNVPLAECEQYQGQARECDALVGSEVSQWLHPLVQIETNRSNYAVAGADHRIIGMMSVDFVYYPESGQRLFLIEIEAIGSSGHRPLMEVQSSILSILGSKARPDSESKVKRGIRYREARNAK